MEQRRKWTKQTEARIDGLLSSLKLMAAESFDGFSFTSFDGTVVNVP